MSIKEFMLNFFSIKGRVARFKYTIYTVVMVFLGTFFHLGILIIFLFFYTIA
jgi:hypothetical protein